MKEQLESLISGLALDELQTQSLINADLTSVYIAAAILLTLFLLLRMLRAGSRQQPFLLGGIEHRIETVEVLLKDFKATQSLRSEKLEGEIKYMQQEIDELKERTS